MKIVPRQEIFDTYWRFAAERQRIFFRRLAGRGGPWTEDPILQRYKFCSAYRASDRASQFLIRHVIYGAAFSRTEEDVVFRTLLFRLFNHVGTFEHLEAELGEPRAANFQPERYARSLEKRAASGEKLFGSAFILCATKAFGYDRKHDNYLALLKHMLGDGVVGKVVSAPTFGDVYRLLLGYPLIGKFMAYQIATDLNYSEVIDFDEDTFTMAGPGAVRGIAKCFEQVEGCTREDVIRWTVDEQEGALRRLGVDPAAVWLWGRPFKAIDCQNLFCETDKYCRVAFPHLKTNRSRIKVTFRATPKRVEYFYPPKWGINGALADVPEQPLVRSASATKAGAVQLSLVP